MFKEYDGIQIQVELDRFNSEHFGLRMGDMSLCLLDADVGSPNVEAAIAAGMEGARREGFQHLTCRVDTANKIMANAVIRNGFRIVDTVVRFCFWIRKSVLTPVTHRCEVGDCRKEDIPRLREIARTSFQIGRFHSDPDFPNELCDQYYEKWFENSCHGFADKVLVAYRDGSPEGFATGRYRDGDAFARMDLIAVSQAAREIGMGSSLEAGILRWAADLAGQKPEMKGFLHGTQIDNLAMQEILVRMGFMPYESRYVFHRTI